MHENYHQKNVKNFIRCKIRYRLRNYKRIDDSKVKKLELYTKSGNLQKYLGKTLEGYEREIKRAEVIKQIVKNKNKDNKMDKRGRPQLS